MAGAQRGRGLESRRRLRLLVERDAGNRCGYCLSSALLTGIPLVLEHLVPQVDGGATVRENLWLSCYRCNEFKGRSTDGIDPLDGERVPLFNPRRQAWPEHFRWSPDGTTIIGTTPVGTATVSALRLNNDLLVTARRCWVVAGWHLAGWHPPQ